MKKKLLLLSLVGTTTLTSLVIAGLTLSDASSFTIAANGGNVQHNLVMTTENTTVSVDGEDGYYDLNMDTYTANGNRFSAYDSSFDTIDSEDPEGIAIHCNTEDALLVVEAIEKEGPADPITLSLYICFDFNLDVAEGENVAACMYFKLKTSGGWDEEPTWWDWGGLDAEGNHALFTFDKFVSSCWGFKLISCNFTYSCSY